MSRMIIKVTNQTNMIRKLDLGHPIFSIASTENRQMGKPMGKN